MKTSVHHFNNEKGSVIVAAVMILACLTIIGFAASNMSTTEVSISTNSLLYERAFYSAEAGLQHAKESLREQFHIQNQAQIAIGQPGYWDFALNGSLAAYGAAADTDGDSKGSYEDGVVWIPDTDLQGVHYTVTIWNNDDGGSHTDDTDGMVWVRADSWEPRRGGRCSIVELVKGSFVAGGATSGYTAQEGLGSGKGYTSDDSNPVDFNDPGFGQQI